MTRLERWGLSVILYATTCIGCAPHRLVPMSWRPDTRAIAFVRLDSLAFMGSLTLFTAAMPNEGSVCYMGLLRDTTVEINHESSNWLILELVDVTASQPDSADRFHVYYHDTHAGCPESSISIGHSHPYARVCDHSNDDAELLFANKSALVSLAWCINGEFQMLFQDGRREPGRWKES